MAPLALAPLALALSTAVVAPSAYAQSADVQLDPTVVTASRTEQKLTQALAATTVISRQDIENSQEADLPSLLRGRAGVEIVQNGGPGTSASLFMRGANSNSSLVLIDGVPVSSATLGTTAIEQLQLSQIDHIEIVRGNVSALYGSQAVGGVVQIFTRKGGDHAPRMHAEVGYGRYNTTQANAGIDGALGEDHKTRFSLNVSRFHTDGFSALDPRFAPRANPNKNGYDNTSVTAQLSRQFAQDWEVGARLYQSDGSTSFDNAFGKPTDLNDTDSRVRQLSTYVNGRVTSQWLTKFALTQGDDYSYTYLNGNGNGNVHTSSSQIDWQNEYALNAEHKLLAGYTRLEQTVDGSTAFGHNNRHVDSGYAGYEGQVGRNQFQANVRRDQYSDFGGANSYFLGYGFLVTPEWKLFANASNAFRAPTFNELFYPGFGNPNVQPERAISKELGVQYNGALGLVRLTAFQTDYTNLIATALVNGQFLAQNVKKARVQGAELTYSANLLGVDVRASGTMQNPTDEQAGTTLPRRARRFANLSLSKAFGKIRVGGDIVYSGERIDTGAQHLGAYATVNVQARYDIDKSWYVSAHVDNLFNKNYQTAYGYNTPGTAAYITLGWKQF